MKTSKIEAIALSKTKIVPMRIGNREVKIPMTYARKHDPALPRVILGKDAIQTYLGALQHSIKDGLLYLKFASVDAPIQCINVAKRNMADKNNPPILSDLDDGYMPDQEEINSISKAYADTQIEPPLFNVTEENPLPPRDDIAIETPEIPLSASASSAKPQAEENNTPTHSAAGLHMSDSPMPMVDLRYRYKDNASSDSINVETLVDSGATYNLINRKVAERSFVTGSKSNVTAKACQR